VKTRRSRPPIRTHQQPDTTTSPQQDEATGAVPNRTDDSQQPEYVRAKLPHERDETPPPQGEASRKPIERGQEDIAAGRKDTDCYGEAGEAFDRKSRRGGVS
jgi:hypothetical protein